VSGDNKLDVIIPLHQIMWKKQKTQLTLRRQGSLGFVHKVEAGAGETILQQGQK
jgi:hypothetical protein